MNTKQKLDKQITELLSSRKAFTSYFTIKNFKEYIDSLIDSHNVVISATKHLSDSKLKKLSFEVNTTKNKSNKYLSPYFNYLKNLDNKAKSMENKLCVSSLIEANELYINILNSIKDNAKKYFTGEKINLFNMKLSHVIIMGILYQSRILSTFTFYMFDVVSSFITDTSDDVTKYKIEFLNNNGETIAETVSALLDNSGEIVFEKVIEGIKIKSDDFNLISIDSKSQVPQMNIKNINSVDARLINNGTKSLTPFRLLGEIINRRKKETYDRNKVTEEWLKAKIALLISNLDEVDKESSEYKKLERVIDKYAALINKYERLILKYEES